MRVEQPFRLGDTEQKRGVLNRNSAVEVCETADGGVAVTFFQAATQASLSNVGPDPDVVLTDRHALIVDNGKAVLVTVKGEVHCFDETVCVGAILDVPTGVLGVLGTVNAELVTFVLDNNTEDIQRQRVKVDAAPISRVALTLGCIYFSVGQRVFCFRNNSITEYAPDADRDFVVGLAAQENGSVAILTPMLLSLYKDGMCTLRVCDLDMAEVGYVGHQCVVTSTTRGQAFMAAYPCNFKTPVCGVRLSVDEKAATVAGNNTFMAFVPSI